ncbi:hypothetical protein CEXT_118801 [Caerostris extrusa]|uniref:Uncharacterized protein n=1 Tax=Caerostris extrusa TaxID=172846 RepID=A0AAV4X5Z1_CAEEX|nr:hypothetical protein CEXT_118801 [Caerostris extrusa]
MRAQRSSTDKLDCFSGNVGEASRSEDIATHVVSISSGLLSPSALPRIHRRIMLHSPPPLPFCGLHRSWSKVRSPNLQQVIVLLNKSRSKTRHGSNS